MVQRPSVFAVGVPKREDQVIAKGRFTLKDWERQLVNVVQDDVFRIKETENGVNLRFDKVHPDSGMSVAKLQQRLPRRLSDFRFSLTFRPELPVEREQAAMQGIAAFDAQGDGVVVRLGQNKGNELSEPPRKFVMYKYKRHILSERSDPLGSKLISDLSFLTRPMTLTLERIDGEIRVYAESGETKILLGSRTHPAMDAIEVIDVRLGGYRYATIDVDLHEYSLVVPARRLDITSW